MGAIKRGLEELAFRGLKLAFEKRHVYNAILRVDDEKVLEHENITVMEMLRILERMSQRVFVNGLVATAVSKVTLEHGYLIVFVATITGKEKAFVTIELSRQS